MHALLARDRRARAWEERKATARTPREEQSSGSQAPYLGGVKCGRGGLGGGKSGRRAELRMLSEEAEWQRGPWAAAAGAAAAATTAAAPLLSGMRVDSRICRSRGVRGSSGRELRWLLLSTSTCTSVSRTLPNTGPCGHGYRISCGLLLQIKQPFAKHTDSLCPSQ